MRVSVIVPAYNCEKYIIECLDSIFASTLADIEIIVVDDGSTDATMFILNEYVSKEKIKLIHQKNAGASAARNAGLEIAMGEYIGFVDADDWIEPDMYEKMYKAAVENDADIAFCNIYRNQSEKMCKYMDSGVYGKKEIVDIIFPLLISNLEERSHKSTLRGSTWSKLYRKSLLDSYFIRYHEDLIYNEDGLFSIEATIKAKKYVYLGDDYLYHNRVTPGSVTKRYIHNLWSRQIAIMDYLNAVNKESSYDFSRQIAKKLFEVAVYCVENECKSDNPNSRVDKQKILKTIVCDKNLIHAMSGIDWTQLSNINRAYYWAFRFKCPMLSSIVSEHRKKKHTKARKE